MATIATSSAAPVSPVRRNLTLDLVDTVTERLGVASAIIEVVRDRETEASDVDTLLAEASSITDAMRALVEAAWREAAEPAEQTHGQSLDELQRAAELASARAELAGACDADDDELSAATEECGLAMQRYFLTPASSIEHLLGKLRLFVNSDAHELIYAKAYLTALAEDAHAISLKGPGRAA